jgi:hypothetical protein
MGYYNANRLSNLARNILFGMDVVSKRCDAIYESAKDKKLEDINFDMSEDAKRRAINENKRFFSDQTVQKRLKLLQDIIVDDTHLNKLRALYGQ